MTRWCRGCGKALVRKRYESARLFGRRQTCDPDCRGLAQRVPLAERFWAKVRKTDGCWWWTGATVASGYGSVGVRSYVTRPAHVVAYELATGQVIPRGGGLYVCHHCDNRLCVRPGHLFLGTHTDNQRDMVAKGRHQHGERHAQARLTADDVQGIRRRAAEGWSSKTIAAAYGVSRHHVGAIIAGRFWRAA